MTKEIVSLQVGTNANYIGAHFWNLQDEYLATPIQQRDLSPAAMFYEISPSNRAYASGLRYAPRLQIIDASGAFGALSTQAGVILPSLSEKPTASAWNGHHQLFERDPVAHSQYIRHIHSQEANANLPIEPGQAPAPSLNDINYWTDYFKVRLHPRTCFQLSGVHHQVSNLDHFATGEQLVKPLLEDMYHDLRHFVEDCDSFGGLNVTTNADDAFSGITAVYLDHIMEELGSSLPVMAFGMHSLERSYSDQRAHSLGAHSILSKDLRLSANEAQLVTKCMDYSAEYIPLASPRVCQVPNLHVDKQDVFQASAVLGLALDVALVPLRQRLSLSGMLGSIRPQPFATLGNIAVNLPPSRSKFHFGRNLFETDGTVNMSVMRDENLSTSSKRKDNRDVSFRCFECVSARGLDDVLPICTNISQPVTLPIPFPPVFDALSRAAVDIAKSRSPVRSRVLPDQIAVISGIGTIPKQGQDMLTDLAENLRKSALSKHQSADDAQLSELTETLVSCAEDYGNL